MADKQTVADGRPKGGSEVASQESDIAALVRQYEKDTGDQEGGLNTVAVLKAIKPAVDFANSEMARRDKETSDKFIGDAYDFVAKDDALKGFKLSKPLVRGFLEAYGVENEEFGKAFRNQQNDPDAWKTELAKGRDWVKEQLKGLPTSNIRSDLEAAQAAVAGTSTDEAEAPKIKPAELFEMSDSDFAKFEREEIAKASMR